jgi:transposase
VTRDRASAYASAISEVLPDAMQITDRFHLHQNLLEVIQTVLKSIIPASIKIPHAPVAGENNPTPMTEGETSHDAGKKNAPRCG